MACAAAAFDAAQARLQPRKIPDFLCCKVKL